MKKQKFTYRILALAMSLCMIFTMMPLSAYATTHEHDANCGYAPASECTHSHDDTCGYADAVVGSACTHSCTDGSCSYVAASDGTPCNHTCDFDVCGYYPAIPGTSCDKGCSEIVDGEIRHDNCNYSEGEPEMPCNHTHDDSCGYVAPIAGVACDHQHDANCGYAEAVEAQPCTHEHDTTCGYSEGSDCTYVEPIEEATTYYVSVNSANSSWGELSGMGYYTPGDTVTITANPYDGYHFYTWVVAQGSITLADEDSQTTTFIMPEENVTITANLREHKYIISVDNEDGTHSGSCLFCDVKGNPQPHTPGGYEADGENGHYANCTECNYQTSVEAHVYDGSADTDCNVCGYIREAHTHTWGDYISNGDGSHTRRCTANGCTAKQSEDCNGTATCHEFAICSYCGVSHGGYDELNHSGGTEVRGAKDATETENGYTGDTYCLGCGILISEGSIVQATGSGDDDGDTHTHYYYYYKYDGTNHWKMCGCGQGQAGSVKAHTLLVHGNNNGHWKECTICDYYSDIQDHVYSNDSDASCNDCGYERHVHDYSTAATCMSPAKCSCGATTGDKDPSNHDGGTMIINAVEATYKTEGYTGDTYCLGCDAKLESGKSTMRKGFVDVKYDDDAVVKEVTFQPVEGVTLPDDAEVIVKDYTATFAPIDSLLGRDVNTEYLDINDLDISIIENDTYTHSDGTEYRIFEIISINGEEYVIVNWTGMNAFLSLIRLSDGASCIYNAVTNELDFRGSLITPPEEYPFERVNINGVTYDVVLHFVRDNNSQSETILYYNGIPAGRILGSGYYFHEGYDPATLAAQQNKSFLATVTIPQKDPLSKTREELVADLEAAQQAYDEYVRVNFTMSAKLAMAKSKAEQALAEYDAITQLAAKKKYNVYEIGANDISVMNATAVSGTVTQTFDVPAEFVGNENVKFIAVHDTNPYAEALAEAIAKQAENFTMEGAREYLDIKALYDEWEATHGNGAQFGGLSISKDGKTLTATYAVDGFSPFIVYAFVEADEPEIKTLSATIVDGSDDATETPDTSEPVVSPQTSDNTVWYILIAVVAGAIAVVSVVYGKRRKSKAN